MNALVHQWLQANCMALDRLGVFGRIRYDHIKLKWVMIEEFVLPPMIQQARSTLLIRTPGFNIENHRGYDFYVDLKLRRLCRDREQHLFDGGSYNDMKNQQFARLSLHLGVFRPRLGRDFMQGHTYLNLAQVVYNFLGSRW